MLLNSSNSMSSVEKAAVASFWDDASCGEELYLEWPTIEGYRQQAEVRYRLEPYIETFADFANSSGRKILEIGVGLGADHQQFAEAGAELFGCDLTPRAVEHTRRRFQLLGLKSVLRQADAEALPYDDASFDLVYSWGVLHHSPDTPAAVNEVHRVLKAGGRAKVMIYHKYSLVGYMLWLRYGLGAFKPTTSLQEIYSRYLESPGTKAYSVAEAHRLFQRFSSVTIRTVLTHADLLTSAAGQRHEGTLLTIARLLWPRWFLKHAFASHGLFMLVDAVK